MLNSDVYLATTTGFSPLCTLDISQITISSLFLASLPTLARKRPSWEKLRHFRDTTGIVTIVMHLAVAQSQIRIMEFFPSWADASILPAALRSKQTIGAECPKKNLFCQLLSVSIEIRVPPLEKMTTFSPSCLDHLIVEHISAWQPIMCLSSMIGSLLSLCDLESSYPLNQPDLQSPIPDLPALADLSFDPAPEPYLIPCSPSSSSLITQPVAG